MVVVVEVVDVVAGLFVVVVVVEVVDVIVVLFVVVVVVVEVVDVVVVLFVVVVVVVEVVDVVVAICSAIVILPDLTVAGTDASAKFSTCRLPSMISYTPAAALPFTVNTSVNMSPISA